MNKQELSGGWVVDMGLNHNAHFGKIIIFCKISDLKITLLEIIFNQYFCLVFTIFASGFVLKNIILVHKLVCIS